MSTLTIVPVDKVIIVDGIPVVCDFDIDPDIHAVQWDGTKGWIEWKPGVGKELLKLTSINDYQSYITLHGEEKEKQEQERLQAEQDELEKTPLYQRQRLEGYGDLGDQLDMIYWDKKNGSNLWESHIETVKATYPKS